MSRLVNENISRLPQRAPRRARYLLISLGIHAAAFFALAGSHGERWLGRELAPTAQVAIRFSETPAASPAAAQSAAPESPAPRADAPAEKAPSPATDLKANPAASADPAAGASADPAESSMTADPGASQSGTPAQLVTGAERTGTPRPPYPRWARERGWEGRLVLELEILPSGRVGEVTILESTGHEKLDEHTANWAKDALRFEPATLAGVPVATSYRLALRYDLRERG